MDSIRAFMFGEQARAQNRPQMVFDWDKAARMLIEQNAKYAEAGLWGDWEWTGGEIWRDREPVYDSYTFLSSNWAPPQISIDGGERVECWRFESDDLGWDHDTKWPESALMIISKNE